jgi:hypothetical protein
MWIPPLRYVSNSESRNNTLQARTGTHHHYQREPQYRKTINKSAKITQKGTFLPKKSNPGPSATKKIKAQRSMLQMPCGDAPSTCLSTKRSKAGRAPLASLGWLNLCSVWTVRTNKCSIWIPKNTTVIRLYVPPLNLWYLGGSCCVCYVLL